MIDRYKRGLDLHAHGRRRVVAVIGSGQHADPCCAELGRMIAGLGFDLLTGAGGGVMEAVSRAFFETSPRTGIVVGVVPATVTPMEWLERRASPEPRPSKRSTRRNRAPPISYAPPPGYPNEWVELAIYTHLPARGPEGTLRSSRNHINVLSADAIIALPGQEGTEAEIWLATQYGIPVIAYGAYGAYGDRDAAPPHGIPRGRSIAGIRAFLEARRGT